MRVILSPYHLTTREPPAMAALLLGENVVTMMPAPLSDFGQSELHAAVRSSPRYMRFIESWSWSLPLWRDGVIASSWQGDDPTGDVREVCRAIDERPEFGPLRPLMRRSLFENQREYLDFLASDLLKGGPDPGISVPMAAGLDRFATRHGLMAARSDAVSVAQRAEVRGGSRLFAMALPILLQAGGESVLRGRAILAKELHALHGAVERLTRSAVETEHEVGCDPGPLREAAAEYCASFDRHRTELCRVPRDEERVIDGFVTVTALAMLSDSVLSASLAAVRLLGAVTGVRSSSEVSDAGPSTLPVVRDALSGRRFVSLIVKVMGRSR